jgi:CRISPR-associated endonuclease/helicase Cas3
MNIDPNRLWAKSQGKNEPFRDSMLLPQHLVDVHKAAERVLDATGDAQLAALGLDREKYRCRLRQCVLLAAAVHDLGKANNHFAGMICGTRDVRQNPQGLRHEWVTILMLKGLRTWLLPAVGSPTDFDIVEWTVAGHHPAHNHESPPRTCPAGAGPEIELLLGHKDFVGIVSWLKTTFSTNNPTPTLHTHKRNLVGSANVFHELAGWAKAARRLWEEKFHADDKKLVAVVKNCLIATDVAGSALPREVADVSKRWEAITESFRRIPSVADLQFLADYGLEGNKPREFQTAVADAPDPVVFVKAGCGSGKTVAAYLRAAKRFQGRRLYFCYPTTGTATEGFKDYLYPEIPERGKEETEKQKQDRKLLEEIGADLFHGRSAVDFEIILSTGSDSQKPDADSAIKADSLDAWATPVVACTVDTVLGLVQNNKRGLFAWPALAQSAFVFDEIHAFDDRLFGALLRFLRDLPGLPVLLMTASLPKAREEALSETLKKFRGIELKTIPGPESLEILPRYHKLKVENNDPLPAIEETLKSGGKVLWVCNTVGRVMKAAEETKQFGPLLYHSRFKYKDRVERHKAVIDAFKGKGAALAICSQVAEMSLDLSADLLVTDRATVPALIQRLGRLNRRAKWLDEQKKVHDPTKPFIVIEPENHLPYTPADLEAAKVWLDKLPAIDITQRQLAEMWEQSAENPPHLVASAWLDGGPTTTVTELREAAPGISVLMEADVDEVRKNPKSLGKFVLPMPPPPRVLDWRTWKMFRGLPVAPPEAIGPTDYDPMRGAKWAEQPKQR